MSNACLYSSVSASESQEKSSATGQPYFLSTDRTFEKTSGRFIQGSGVFSSKVLSVGKKTPSHTLFGSVPTNGGFVSIRNRVPSTAGEARPILDHISDELWKDGSVPVAGKKCSCKSVWCPTCFKYRYRDRIKSIFANFDWRFTRQVVLTVDPSQFDSPSSALLHIREKHILGEFIRRLRRGVKKKAGSLWLWKIHPVNIIRWAWFMEFHSNGFPHFHVFIQTDQKGRAGMLNGDRLRDNWPLAPWVKETYFNSEEHFKNLTGYYADKGYFDKGKKYQGLLPDDILDKIKTKIRRMNSSERKQWEKVPLTEEQIEESNYQRNIDFFEQKKNELSTTEKQQIEAVNAFLEHQEAQPEKQKQVIDYRAILANCGKATFVELDLGNYRMTAICDMDWQKWKSFCSAVDSAGRGYIAKLNKDQVTELLSSVRRVCSLQQYIKEESWPLIMVKAEKVAELYNQFRRESDVV